MDNDPSAGGRPNLTVSEAARILGVSERTLRRLLSLAAFDEQTVAIERQTQKGRRRTETLPPVLVDALRAHIAPNTPAGGAATAGETTADTAANGGNADELLTNTTMAQNALLREAVARLEDENTRVWETLRAEQANTAAALAELSRAREQSQVLIAATAAGRLQIEPTQEATHADLRGDSGELGQTAAHDKPRPFWAFWQKKKEGG